MSHPELLQVCAGQEDNGSHHGGEAEGELPVVQPRYRATIGIRCGSLQTEDPQVG
jgi:hypothetical protein